VLIISKRKNDKLKKEVAKLKKKKHDYDFKIFQEKIDIQMQKLEIDRQIEQGKINLKFKCKLREVEDKHKYDLKIVKSLKEN